MILRAEPARPPFRPLLWLVLLLILALPFAGPSVAQEAAAPDMTEILEKAARDGMRVIVIEPPTGATAPAAAEGPVGAAPDFGAGVPGAAYRRLVTDPTLLTRAQSRMQTFRENLRIRLRAFPSAIVESRDTLARSSPTGDPRYFRYIILWTLVFLAISYGVNKYAYGYLFVYKRFVAMQTENPQGLVEKLPILVARLGFGVVGLLITLALAGAIGAVFFGAPANEAAEKTVLIIFATYVVLYVINMLWRLILAPYLSQYRIPIFSDADARRLFNWLAVSATVSIVTFAYCEWIHDLGISADVHAIATAFLTLLSVLFSIATIIFNHRSITNAILRGGPRERAAFPARMAGTFWAPLAIGYFLLAWAEMTYRLIMGQELGFPLIIGAYTILMSIIVVYGIVVYAIERFFQRRKLVAKYNRAVSATQDVMGTSDMPTILRERGILTPTPEMRTFEDLAARIAGILAFFAGGWALTQIWRVRQMEAMQSVIDNGLDIAVVLFLGYIAYHAVRIAIDRKIEEEGGDVIAAGPGDEGNEVGASRLATLLPLFRSILLFTIIVAVFVIALMEMGINVGPIFAGAGIVGIAVGFGAQFLVRDIFSGAFFLIDDAFRKGEYIDTGAVKGTVEKISIRSFQLRHHLGPLHTIPFGEIQNLTNYSRDWVIMKLPLRVTYDTDVGKVRKLVKNLGIKLLEDPDIGSQFLQPLKSQGVIEMQDSAMIIRVKFMTKPGDQWIIRQRVYQEIRQLFLAEGIKFAHREVTVRVASADIDVDKLTPQQKEAIAGAALAEDDDDAWDKMPDLADSR